VLGQKEKKKKKVLNHTVWHSWKCCIFRYISKSCQNSDYLLVIFWSN